MVSRQGVSTGVLLAVATGVLWTVGAVLFCATVELRPEGLLLVIGGAMATSLLLVRTWLLRMRAAYMHGFHAGFHDQAVRACDYPLDDCPVLELAELRARRINSA